MHHEWIRGLAVISMLVLVAGCKPAQLPVYSGNAELTFVQAMPNQLQFRVSNQSSIPLSFRGSRGDELGADPWDFEMECLTAGAVAWDGRSSGVTDGNPKHFEIAPGHQLLIRVSSDFASRYKKGRCHLTMWFIGNTQLTSNDFEP